MNNDLISREALKEAFEDLFYNDVDDQERTERLIDNAPTVEVRPQGKWKHIIDEYNDVECPFCGFQEDGIYNNFCPKCGADMRGGAEE